MYSEYFCKIYNEFGWNYFPEAFAEQLLIWLKRKNFKPESMLDIGCGTGVLCDILESNGIHASGIDLSEGMIKIAQKEHSRCEFAVEDMVTYCPGKEMYGLVTCTGDALNHIMELKDVKRVFNNVYSYLKKGGYFIFDILNEKETGDGKPIDLEYSDTVSAQFQIIKNDDGSVTLSVSVSENGKLKIKEEITEIVHNPDTIMEMLKNVGFSKVTKSDRLLEENGNKSTTWYIIAQK